MARSTTSCATTPSTRRATSSSRRGSTDRTTSAASLGGPVKIPNVYNGTNRTFFFVAYEGFMNDQASNATTLSVPTPEMYNGDFSNWVDANGRMIVVYDPATTRPNPSGTGFIRDPFPGNRIPASRFSTVAQQYLALARGVVVPNREGLVPGTQGYVSNNYLSPGGTTVEKTNKFSLKLDHTLSDRHRLSYLFNRTTNRVKPGDSGPAGLPLPFNTFQSTSFDGDLHRGELGLDRPAAWSNHFSFGVNTFNKDAFSPNVGQGWAGPRSAFPNAVDCNDNFGIVTFTPSSRGGEGLQQRDRAAAARGEGRLHAQPRRRTPSRPASPTIASRPTASASRTSAAGRASAFRGTSIPRRDDAGQRRRELVRVVPARRRRQRPDRDHPLSPAGLFVLFVLRAGRLAAERQAGPQLRRALRVHAAAGRRRRSVPPTSRRRRRTRRSTTIRARSSSPATVRDARAPAAWCPATTARGARASASPTAPPTRRPSAAASADPSGASRSRRAAATLPASSASTCSRTPDSGVTPGVQPRSGPAGLPAAAADRSDVLEQQRRGLVQRPGGHTAGGLRQLDDLDAAGAAEGTDGGGRLQRRVRLGSAGEPDQPQPGADVGRERSHRAISVPPAPATS